MNEPRPGAALAAAGGEAELAPVTSRHSPDCTPVTVPLALTFHCWLAWPLQGQTITFVPAVVPRPEASRHIWVLPA